MHKQIIISIFFLLAIAAKAQNNVKLEGFVTDSLLNPLEMANVMALNLDTKAMDSYGITNDKGRFQLSLKANSRYTVKISFIGFKPKEVTVETQNENIYKTISLQDGGLNLDGVEIVQEMPVSIRGDTIIYNADSFKTGTERKLEDILKKLPGVDVNANGEIEVEGKKVTQLLVDGKKFFEGDTKLGSKNIPSDAVDKVQVLRNFSDVSQLKGLENNNDDVAINIKLKEGKKNFWFGDVTGGVGAGHKEGRYIINPKLFYYSPKTGINVISNLNNIGDVPFSLADYFRLTGGARNTIGRSGTNFNIASNDLGISTERDNKAVNIENKVSAINLTQQVSKTWSLSGFGIFSSTKTRTDTQSQNGIFQPNSTEIKTMEDRSDISNLKNNLAILKLGSKYKPSADFQLDYDVSMKRSNQTEDNDVITSSTTFYSGTTTFSNNTINSFKNQDPVSVNQSLSMFWTQNKKSTWAFEVQHLYQDEDPFYNPVVQNDPFPIVGFNQDQSSFNINQSRFVKTNKLDAKADYYYFINNKSIFNITLGNTNSRQGYNSSIFQLLDNGNNFNITNPLFNNNVKYSFNDGYLGLHYKFITGKFTFNPGVSFHRYNIFNDQSGTRVRDDFSRLLPDVFAQYQIKKSEQLVYNYRMSNSFNDIASFGEGYTFNNFNSLSVGNRFLENALQETHSLRYSKYNLFNYTTIFGFLNYSKTKDPVVTRVIFDGINQISQRVNADFENENLSGIFSYQRSFAKFYKAAASVNMNWGKFNTLRVNPQDPNNAAADFIQATEQFSQSYRISFGTQFKDLPNIEGGYSISLRDQQSTTFRTHQPFVKLDYFFLNAFSFVADYNYYNYSNSTGTVKNTYDFLNMSLSYRKKDAKMEYGISATNLLNTRSLNDDNFGQTGYSTSRYIVQPRYILFNLKYNL